MKKLDKEIPIKELFWKIVFSWKYLLILALIAAIFSACISYLGDLKVYHEARKELETHTEKEEIQYSFSKDEENQLLIAKKLQNQIDEKLRYLNDSVKMNIPADSESVLIMTWYIESHYQFNFAEDIYKDYTEAVIAAYREYVQRGILAQRLSDKLELEYESKYLQEVLEIEEAKENTVFSITLIYPNQDSLQDISDMVKNELSVESVRISEEIGSHSLKLLSEEILEKTDVTLANYQKSMSDSLISCQNQLKSIKDVMNEEQLRAFELGENKTEHIEIDSNKALRKPAIRGKNILFGILLGLFIGIVWVVCRTMFSPKLQNIEDIKEMYGVKILGIVEKQTHMGAVERMILKVKNRGKEQLPEENVLDMIVSNISIICKKKEISSLYLTGSDIEKIDDNILEKFVQKLHAAGIEIAIGKNICFETESLKSMVDIGNVIILEQTGTSIYDLIEKELGMMKEYGAELIGTVGIQILP